MHSAMKHLRRAVGADAPPWLAEVCWLARIPPASAQALKLHLRGCSSWDIAAILSISPDAAYRRLQMARHRLNEFGALMVHVRGEPDACESLMERLRQDWRAVLSLMHQHPPGSSHGPPQAQQDAGRAIWRPARAVTADDLAEEQYRRLSSAPSDTG